MSKLMINQVFKVKSKVWMYEGESPWHFVTIDRQTSEELKRFDNFPRRGFGSIPVKVTIGKTAWKTSIFPQKDGTYILPLKKEVRIKENIKSGEIIKISLTYFLQSSS